MISNTRVIRPKPVNEARFRYIGFFNSLGTELANRRNVEGELVIPGLGNSVPAVWGSPTINVLGFSPFRGPQYDPHQPELRPQDTILPHL